MRAVFASENVELLSTVSLLAALAGMFWQPAESWPIDLAVLTVIVAIIASDRQDAQSDRRRKRHRAWLIPSILVAMAAQLVLGAPAQEYPRAMVLAGILVVAGIAWIWSQRRVTK